MPSTEPTRKSITMRFGQLTGGLNSAAEAYQIGDNQLTVCENFEPKSSLSGALKKRQGFNLLNANEFADASVSGIKGIHKFYIAGSGAESIVIASNTDLAVFNGTDTFTTLSQSLSAASLEVNFAVFNDLLIAVNGVDGPIKYDGTTASALGGTPPTGFNVAVFNNHVWMDDASNPSRIHYSALNNPEDWTTADDAGSFDLDLNSGDHVTAVIPQRNRLLIFKNNAIYKIVGDEDANFYVRKISDRLGAPTARAVAILDDIVVFLHSSGAEHTIYSIGPEASAPEIRNVSFFIAPTVQEKTSTGYFTPSAIMYRREYWLAYTNLGSAANDRVFHLLADTSSWSDYTNQPFNIMIPDDKAGTNRIYAGSVDSGFAYTLDTGTQDDPDGVATNIVGRIRTKAFNFDVDDRKRVNRITYVVDLDEGDDFDVSMIVDGQSTPTTTLARTERNQDLGDRAAIYWEPDPAFSIGREIAVELIHRNNSDFAIHEIEMDITIG